MAYFFALCDFFTSFNNTGKLKKVMQKGKNVGVIVKRLTLKETYAKRAFSAHLFVERCTKQGLFHEVKSFIRKANKRR
ncbi:MAG: hypothetical protein IJR44_05950 [Neisseriaceae bacterium]|nr:hypothetical protein [Neisseriaceae bacterium]